MGKGAGRADKGVEAKMEGGWEGEEAEEGTGVEEGDD